MADRTALGLIGYILGGVTAIVMMIGATLVTAQLSEPSNLAPGYYGTTLSAKSR